MRNLNDMVSSENYLDSFKAIADLVLNKSKLVVKDREFEITEIEFYYTDDEHKDPFTHRDALQKTSNRWYVHSVGRGGIDITFGNQKAFGGILIRGLKEIGSNTYINGPLNVLDAILRDNLTTNSMRLESRASMNKRIYQGPRFGLRPNVNDDFLVKPYRFVVDINSNHRFEYKIEVYLYTLKLYPELKKEILSNIFNLPLQNKDEQIRRERIISYLEMG